MTTTTPAFDEMVLWFLDQKEISEAIKEDFTQHLLEIGGFDAEALVFMNIVIKALSQRSTEKMAFYKDQLDKVEQMIALEKDPATSLRIRDLKNAKDQVELQSSRFIAQCQKHFQEQNQQAEQSEKDVDSAAVESLKQSL